MSRAEAQQSVPGDAAAALGADYGMRVNMKRLAIDRRVPRARHMAKVRDKGGAILENDN